MSKEKNLTFIDNDVDRAVINLDGHCSKTVSEETPYANRPYLQWMYLFGPAIDRLHEFEKLGMEPEEIRGRLEAADDYRKEIAALERDNNKLRDLNQRLHDRLTEQTGVVLGLEKENEKLKEWNANQSNTIRTAFDRYYEVRDENKELKEKNQRQAENIAELQKELDKNTFTIEFLTKDSAAYYKRVGALQERIKALEEDCEYFKGERNDAFDEVKRLKVEIDEREKVEGTSYGEIGRLSELVRLQRNAIDGYVESNADLRKKLNRSVESNKALQKQIEFYQDKLDRVVEMAKED